MGTEMTLDQQVLAAWVSAGAAVVQAGGAIAAIVVAVKLARDSERRAIEAEQASAEREMAAEQAAVARAEAADRAAEARITRSLQDQRNGMIESLVALSRELLEEVDLECTKATEQFDRPNFGGTVSGGHAPSHTESLNALIPEWKLAAKDPGLVKAISRLERAIQPWRTPAGGNFSGPAYAAMFRAKRDEIGAAIEEIASYSR